MRMHGSTGTLDIVPEEVIESKILLIRGKKVMFELSKSEQEALRSQFGTLKRGGYRQIGFHVE